MPAAPVRDQTDAAVLFLCQFCLPQDTNLDSLHKARPFMVSAESTNRVYSFYLLQILKLIPHCFGNRAQATWSNPFILPRHNCKIQTAPCRTVLYPHLFFRKQILQHCTKRRIVHLLNSILYRLPFFCRYSTGDIETVTHVYASLFVRLYLILHCFADQ